MEASKAKWGASWNWTSPFPSRRKRVKIERGMWVREINVREQNKTR
jgi:hypothetical protein